MRNIIDRFTAVILLCVLSPIFILASILILALDGSPVIFLQERLGEKRKPFVLYKFRTMRNGRMTRPGRWLRMFGLDELPQLINVIQGNMSFVGPRPLTQEDVTRLGWDDPAFDVRWESRPGITGPAQLLPVCDSEKYFEMDRAYVCSNDRLKDLRVLFATAATVFSGKKTRVRV